MTTDDRTLPLCDGAVFQQLMIINCPCTHEEQMIPMSVQTQDGYLGANGQCYCTISQASKAFPWGLLYLRDLSHWLSFSGLDTQHTIACDPQSPSLSPLGMSHIECIRVNCIAHWGVYPTMLKDHSYGYCIFPAFVLGKYLFPFIDKVVTVAWWYSNTSKAAGRPHNHAGESTY